LPLASVVYRDGARNVIHRDRTRHYLGPVNWQTSSMQFSAERVAITKFAMIGFSVRVGGRVHMLEIGFRQRRLIRWECALRSPAGSEENNGDERR
jgi:hypothetical protein